MSTEQWLKERSAVLERYRVLAADLAQCRQALDAMNDAALAGSPDPGEAAMIDRQVRLEEEKDALCERYEQALPIVPLSRSPLTGEIYERTFDAAGLDGLWWHADEPTRAGDTYPETFVGLTGAMRVTAPVENMPFLVQPGPGKPYVVPALLADDWTRAVVYGLRVGHHPAWAITYFSGRRPEDRTLVDEWGLDVAFYLDDEGQLACEAAPIDPDGRDFNLVPWIASGRLLWIVPEDQRMVLRSGLEGCPYLDVEGTERDQYVIAGQCTEDDDPSYPEGDDVEMPQAELDAWLGRVEAEHDDEA